ncbi:MAG: hypothetical protein P9L92_12465 [Candidatus Electryonea clarkiae]|nr:hypothetical protein [Candidatus Electryonea clarkiae]MDP8287568.1 hypothetical protein [Candidatus Electryonea clarkiae]
MDNSNSSSQNRASSETLSQLIVSISHHLNNAIAVIQARAEIIDANNPEEVKQLKSDVDNKCTKIQIVASSLDEIACLEKLRTNEYLDLKDTVLDISERLENNLRKQNVR